ncbi:hypothetical protein HQO42_13745 [Rhodococcus fascians]|nr:hypothetical protein [Rhodococcus fascians]MBY4239549.1 hypothetical protein [Rhodococcus fascians]MBY4253719.1 hypothetical protein [Rhodococcus fascians]MBY4271138.1 hypothetical protein [Rhodococcus fascians]
MNLGDLWEYPFPVDIYGTVAAWFGATLTGLSFAAAAWYYINDKRSEKRLQAMMINVGLHSQKAGLGVTVTNNSAARIQDVRVALIRKSLKDVILDPGSTPIDGLLPKIKRDWETALKQVPLYLPEYEMMIEPGMFTSHTFAGVSLGDMHWCKVTFMDANSVHWQLRIDSMKRMQRHELTKVKFENNRWEYEEGFSDIPISMRMAIWNERRKLKKWVRKNR